MFLRIHVAAVGLENNMHTGSVLRYALCGAGAGVYNDRLRSSKILDFEGPYMRLPISVQ